MAYEFRGGFCLEKSLKSEHLLYLREFGRSRRVKWLVPAASPKDPVRDLVNLPVGVEGEYIIETGGWREDLSVDPDIPPKTQPSLYCPWGPNEAGDKIIISDICGFDLF